MNLTIFPPIEKFFLRIPCDRKDLGGRSIGYATGNAFFVIFVKVRGVYLPVFPELRKPADGRQGRNSSLLALDWLAGMEQLTVSLSITHTPILNLLVPLPTSLPMSPQVRAPFFNKYISLLVKPVKRFTMLTTQHNKIFMD